MFVYFLIIQVYVNALIYCFLLLRWGQRRMLTLHTKTRSETSSKTCSETCPKNAVRWGAANAQWICLRLPELPPRV